VLHRSAATGATRLLAHTLCIGEAGAGDQRQGRCRNHETIGHALLSSECLRIARADNRKRYEMFHAGSGSPAFVF
jgi:hypothetical protein